MTDDHITIAKSTAEIETHFMNGPCGQFKLLVDDASVAGLPFIVFAGPVAEGIENVTPEIPREIMPNDNMLLFVGTSKGNVAAPPGWNFMQGSQGNDGEAYLSAFYRKAMQIETAPTVFALNEHIVAQIIVWRPQARPE